MQQAEAAHHEENEGGTAKEEERNAEAEERGDPAQWLDSPVANETRCSFDLPDDTIGEI